MDIDIRSEKLSDWLLARWALLRIESLREPLPEKAAALQAAFQPEVLRTLLEQEEAEELQMVFRILSPEAFAPLVEELAECWSEEPQPLAWRMAKALARLAPERLVSLLEAWTGAHPLEQELYSLTSLADVLLDLPEGQGGGLAKKLIEFVQRDGDIYLLDLVRAELIRLARRHGHPAGTELVQDLFSAKHPNPYLHTDALLHSYEAVCDDLPYFEMLQRRIAGETEQRFEPLAPLFQPEAPLAALEALFVQGPETVVARIGELLPSGGGPDSPAGIARELQGRSQALERHRLDGLAVFLVALCAAAWARPKPDWAALSASQIAALAAGDLPSLPDQAGALERLRALPPREVFEALEVTLLENEESEGAETLAVFLGKLGHPDAIRPLLASLDSSMNEALADAAAEGLCRFGALAEEALVSRWDDLTEAQQEHGSAILSLIGGEPTARLLLERQADLHDTEAVRLWTTMALGLPDPRLLEVLEKELPNADGIEIPEAYLMQRLLLDRDGPDLERIRFNVMEKVIAEDSEGEWNAGEGWEDEEEEPDLPPLVVELRCTHCGTVADYEEPRIYVDFDQPESPPLVDGGAPCSSCNHTEALELTERGREAVVERTREVAERGWGGGALHVLRIQSDEGRDLPVGAAVARYERALQERPDSVVDLFMLARCFRRAEYKGRALEPYRKCLAREPAYVQAALDLASELEATGSDREALEVLEQTMQHKARWQLFRTPDFPTAADLQRRFADLYNHLREKLQDDTRPKLVASALAVVKAGRNDPCPCGSGKKYKKCCMLKNQ
jgi:SEC-C motif-containing protein